MAISCSDDAALAELLTVITSTSPIPSLPSLKHLYPAQASLFKVPLLAKCRKVIVFDGVSPADEKRSRGYDIYKRRVTRLTREDPVFANTDLVFCQEWVHLAGTVRKALEVVSTPFVFLHQHDHRIVKSFDLSGCIRSMQKNENIKRIQFTRYRNKGRYAGDLQSSWDGPVDTYVEGGADVPLTRCFGWSDFCTITTREYLASFVLLRCGHGFMETFVHQAFKEELKGRDDAGIREVQRTYGTYLYGGLDDGCYVEHTDGRRK